MPAADPITDVQFFNVLPEDAPDQLRDFVNRESSMSAYRFATSDGRVSWVPVSSHLIEQMDDPEAIVRRLATDAIEGLITISEAPAESDQPEPDPILVQTFVNPESLLNDAPEKLRRDFGEMVYATALRKVGAPTERWRRGQ